MIISECVGSGSGSGCATLGTTLLIDAQTYIDVIRVNISIWFKPSDTLVFKYPSHLSSYHSEGLFIDNGLTEIETRQRHDSGLTKTGIRQTGTRQNKT